MKRSQYFLVIFFVMVLALSGYIFSVARPTSNFQITDISKKIDHTLAQNFSGAIRINLDDDPEQEIFIGGMSSPNLFLKRFKDRFHPILIPELSDPKGQTFSITPCDLDGDGRDELLTLNQVSLQGEKSDSRILKYLDGKWTDLLIKQKPITELLSRAYSATCIDRKGNRRYGLAMTNEEGTLIFIESVGETFKDIAKEIGLTRTSKGRSILGVPGTKGRTNIYVGNEDGPNFYFVNNGDGTFTEKAREAGLEDPFNDARGISLIDANNDEYPDLIYGNMRGPTRLLVQGADGKFKDVTPEIMKISTSVNAVVVGDFNLDGHEDVYLNNIRHDNKLFAFFEKGVREVPLNRISEKEMFGISTIAGDLDQNGSYEILNTHGDSSEFPLTLYSIRPVNPWIKLEIRYQSGGVPRGAVVVLTTNTRKQVRVIDSGSGRFANYDADVLFGLMEDETPEYVEIKLPSGTIIPVDTKLDLKTSTPIRI